MDFSELKNSGAFGALEPEYCQYSDSKVAVLPIPYDGTSTWLKGSDRGPEALLEASANMELYDIETDSEVFQNGIVTLDPVECPETPEQMTDVVYRTAKPIFNDCKLLVGIGGEHSVTTGLVRAAVEKYPNLSVLQLDAHSDLRNEYDDSMFNHACVMARVSEICPIAQIGIRSMDSSEKKLMKPENSLFAHQWPDINNPAEWANQRLTDHVYITIDLDVFDPAIMPSTGTPEPGGLFWNDVIKLLSGVIKDKTIVGFDVVELLPNDDNKAPDFLAAKLIYRMLSMIYNKERIQ